MHLEITKPEGYVDGAYHLAAYLEPTEVDDYSICSITFEIPSINKWNIITPLNYFKAIPDENGTSRRMGLFSGGKWETDVYSNGVLEKDNPTSISHVESVIRTSIDFALEKIAGLSNKIKTLA